ncbi:sensor histidine kinase [Halobacteriovorax marinus]|uniref:sensor histidine kinase n=1 Tax=Halobacteriovorax marinus TaxID=97084 RepID=UPI0015615CEF|nr:HAMP domain-containing sensor histidine kinase [Halobacteriovorax marinus]
MLILSLSFYDNLQNQKKISSVYASILDQISKTISLAVKVKDTSTIQQVMANSTLNREGNYLAVLTREGTELFKIGRPECGDRLKFNVDINFLNESVGRVESCIQSELSYFSRTFVAITFFGAFFVILVAYTFNRLIKDVNKPIYDFAEFISNINFTTLELPRVAESKQSENSNIKSLYKNISNLISNLKESQKELLDKEKHMAMSELAAQVAHDIRSPLAALEMVLQSKEEIETNKKELMKNAATRINDIAENLLENYRAPLAISTGSKQHEKIDLLPLAEGIVAEKKIQYQSYSGLSIEIENNTDTLSCDIEANKVEVNRVLSNLINNAAEATEFGGNIVIRLLRKEDKLEILIIDDGPGIPKEKISALTQKGISFGKKNGNGLGLYHAKKTLEDLKGSLEIESELGFGTKVKMTIPATLEKESSNKVEYALLDNDELIRMTWEMSAKKLGINLHTFSHPSELYGNLKRLPKETSIYLDLNLECDESGLDVAKRLFDQGYENIFLATGSEELNLEELDHIKDIVGKKSPWNVG